ncbi:MAG: hypothetical protein WC515_03775 [Candidatus Omnitrophota bacterium]
MEILFQICIKGAELITTVFGEKAVEKLLSLFRKEPILKAVIISARRVSNELKSGRIDIILWETLSNNKELIAVIGQNYKINPQIAQDAISKGLNEKCGECTNLKQRDIGLISARFIEIFTEELPKAEHVPLSVSQTMEATNKMMIEVRTNIAKTLEKKPSTELTYEQSISTSRSNILPAKVSDIDSLEGCKYKTEIDNAKVLMDNAKHESAKIIYEKLINDFKKDLKVPMIAKFKVYNNLGVCYVVLGDEAEASKMFKIAYDFISPPSLIACKNRALACLFEDKPLDGLPYIDAAIIMDPNDNEAINIKFELLMAADKTEEAMTLYRKEG